MRIGIDMLAVQSHGSRQRGIERYSHNFVAAMLARGPDDRFVLYAHGGLPVDQIPTAPNADVVPVRRDPARGERTLADLMDRVARTNPDRLDLLLVLSPFEMCDDYSPPHKPLHGMKVASVLYDLIPFLLQEQYLHDPRLAGVFYGHLRALKGYDALLAISEATRADTLALLGLADDRVTNIGGATEVGYFVPDAEVPMPLSSRRVLQRLGIRRPFVFNVGANDPRKNVRGLIDAFRLLPTPLRQAHQLVITYRLDPVDRDALMSYAESRGVGDELVLTGEVPDDALRVLYQRCAAFAFPSFYEGFGLPLLEAMQCGAAVVAGANSSQGEVVGDAGLLANAHDPADLAAKLARLLDDPAGAAALGRRAVDRAREFSWEETADRALVALRRAVEERPRRPRLRVDAGHSPRPRLAVFSPLPPKESGISDYTARLVGTLRSHYAIDLYHDAGYVPDLGLDSADFGCHDYRLFDRRAEVVDYRGVLYQMGNSHYHRFIYETLLRHPGIVTLHDFCLAGFHHWYEAQPDVEPGHFARELAHDQPGREVEVMGLLPELFDDPKGINVACTGRDLYLNRRVFERAERVVVHSRWNLRTVLALRPEHAARTALVPMGASPAEVSPARRDAVRARFDLPAEALVLGSFGMVHPTKMNAETLLAFGPVARVHPTALLAFVGQECDGGAARRLAEELGIGGRVRFLGRRSASEFADLIAAVDVGINLRRPPTNGETSAALLDLLGAGVATIVTDVGTFADFPDDVVCKVGWEAEGVDGLRNAIIELVERAHVREALGRSARDYARAQHGWARVAALYAGLIEDCQAERPPSRGRRTSTAHGPHACGPTARSFTRPRRIGS